MKKDRKVGSGITKLTVEQINQNWAEKVRASYEEIGELQDMEEMIRFLKSPVYTITFRYALCRFLREKYEAARLSDGKVLVRYERGDGTVFRKAFSEDTGTPLEDEVEDYIRLMLILAADRGMGGMFEGKILRKYLTGRQENVARETLMKMAFAFDMDTSAVCALLESMDEIPYNFRNPEECICYFCQYTAESNYWSVHERMAEGWERICAENEKKPGAAGGRNRSDKDERRDPADVWKSSMMEDEIIELSYDEEDLEQREKKMLQYLEAHKDTLYGFRQAAYSIFDDLMEELRELTEAKDDTDLSIALWSPVWVQFYTKKSDRSRINRSDFVPWKDLLDLPKTVHAKPLWRARIAKLRERKVPVEKRDILFLNCMKWALSREGEGGLDSMHEFLMETNDLLDQAGLSVVYPPNPYDRLMMLAICSGSPMDVLSDLFSTATDQEKLDEQLKKHG